MVMISHGVTPAVSLLPKYLQGTFGQNGFYGVSVFFVISGFLITSNTLRRYGQPAGVDFGQFYAMRIARIFPVLVLFVAVMFALYLGKVPSFVPASAGKFWVAAYKAFTFQYNDHCLHGGNAPGLESWRILWSLSVEEIFYLVFPIACFLTRRSGILVAVLLVLIVRGPMVRHTLYDEYSWWASADQLSMGCLVAIATARREIGWLGKWGGWALQGLGAALLAYTFAFTETNKDFALAPSIVGGGAALFLIGSTSASNAVPLLLRPFTAIFAAYGRASYEIYIFHVAIRIALGWTVTLWMRRWFPAPGANAIVVSFIFLVAILGGAMLLGRWFTEPVNAVIRRFYRKPPGEEKAAEQGNRPASPAPSLATA